MHELSDEKIVEIVREEDNEKYAIIIERYQKKLSHYLKKFISDQDELEDVLQTVFVKAYKNLYDFDTKRKFSSWIYRIAHNEAVNFLKRHSKKGINLDEVEYKIIDKKIDIIRDIDKNILKERMKTALNKLEDKYKDPIILYYFEDKNYEEISDILKIPKNTAGTLIHRGKKQLKIILENNL